MSSTQLHWERAGHGEPLVLLHGMGSTLDDFAALRRRLEPDFDVLAVDLPGHGDSPPLDVRPNVAAITDAVQADLDRLGLKRPHLLGNSLGGRIALELALRHRAASVVAIAPSGMGAPAERAYQGIVMGGSRVAMRLARPLIHPLSQRRAGRRVLLAGLRARPADASETEAMAVDGGFAGSTGFWRMLWWSLMADLPTGLERIDCPVVLAQGTRDLIALGQTPRFLLRVPGSRFRPLLRAGHAPQSDSPDDIVRLVHEAVDRAARTGGKKENL